MVVAFEQRRLPFLRSSADFSVPKDETSSPPQGSPLVLPCRLISSSNDMAVLLFSFLWFAAGGRRRGLRRFRRRHLVEQLAHPPVGHRRQRHARGLAGASELLVQAAPVV